MSNDLVVQLGAKLDQFTSDMNHAGDIADGAVSRIEQSFASLNPGFDSSSLAIGFTAAATGAAALLAYVVSLNKNLADMQAMAKQVGLTLADYQGIQFGGQTAGLSTDQINAGLEKSAQLLNDASRNSNSLSKELEANGLSVKNSNGQLITENQLLTIAAGLISNAKNPGDQLAIAQMLGFTKEWIPLLEQGATAIGQLTGQASAAGAIIDDATVQKAADFDAAWRKSSVEFSTYMRAALADMLPFIDDLIDKSKSFIDNIKNAKPSTPSPLPFLDDSNSFDRTVRNVARAGLNAVGINPDSGIEIKLDPKVTEGWSNFTGVLQQKFTDLQQGASDDLKKQISDLDAWWRGQALDPNFFANAVPRALNLATDGAFPAQPVTVTRSAAPEVAFPSSDAMSGAYPKSGPDNFDALQKQIDKAQDDAQDAANNTSKVVAKDVPKDAFDRAQDQITKRTADYNAETAAVGLNTQAKTQAKAVADLETAAQRAGITLTDQQKQKIQELAVAEGTAAQAAATRNQALQQQNQLLTFAGNQTISILDGLRTGSLTAAQAVTQLTNSLITAFEQALLLGSGPLAGLFGTAAAAGSGTTGGLLGGLFGSFGKSAATGAVASNGSIVGAVGPTSVGGAPLVGFASGTNSAPGGMAIVGENGPELLNLPRGSQVIPNDVLRKSAGAGASVTYNIDASGADSGTVMRIQSVLSAHAKSINGLGGVMQSAQRYQGTGVN